MMAIVKFKDSPIPTVIDVNNSAYIYDLSTMARVEWVSGGYFTRDGQFIGSKDKLKTALLGDPVISPYRHGDPDPLGPYRTSIGGDQVPA